MLEICNLDPHFICYPSCKEMLRAGGKDKVISILLRSILGRRGWWLHLILHSNPFYFL